MEVNSNLGQWKGWKCNRDWKRPLQNIHISRCNFIITDSSIQEHVKLQEPSHCFHQRAGIRYLRKLLRHCWSPTCGMACWTGTSKLSRHNSIVVGHATGFQFHCAPKRAHFARVFRIERIVHLFNDDSFFLWIGRRHPQAVQINPTKTTLTTAKKRTPFDCKRNSPSRPNPKPKS